MIFPSSLIPLLVSLSSLLLATDEVEIVFAGDAMQHESQLRAARTGSGVLDYSACFSAIAPYISSADYAVVNLEAPLGGKPYSGYPMFSAPDAYARALLDAGFDLALTANNHILDRRDRGLRRTLETLDSIGMPHIGTYSSPGERPAKMPFMTDIRGFRCAFLNYTYGTNGIKPGPEVEIDYIDTLLMRRDIAQAHAAGAEIIAVCVHWGVEYRLLPEASQRKLAEQLRAMGADIVMGGHPHVIQPMELTPGPDGRQGLTVFSLGNFISGMRTSDTRGGALASVTLRRDSLGRAYVADAGYRLVFTLTPDAPGENFRLIPAEQSVPDALRDRQRSEFVRRAEEVFSRHNISVGRDSLPIADVVRRRALRRPTYLSVYDKD